MSARDICRTLFGKSPVIIFMLVAAFVAVSCQSDDHGTLVLSKQHVDSGAGSMFLTVETDREWELSVVYRGDASDWIEISPSQGSGNKGNIVLSYGKNDGEEREAEIVAVFGSYSCRETLTQAAKGSPVPDPDPDPYPDPDPDPDPDPEPNPFPGLESDRMRGWLELPAVEEKEGFAWVFHNMNVDGREMRNYSLYYDASDRVSVWVAYPLNSGLQGNGSRHDGWGVKDPKIPVKYQSDVDRGWGVGGYDRGHQLPAADRYRSDAHRMTYYPTNITPQNSRMNQGIWANLEGMVRDWSYSCDTLYVVTGCVPSADNFITDKGGNRVNVPDAYFKALLKYDRSSTISEYMGIGIYVENRPYSEDRITSSMVMNIDSLEEMLGIDFFHNLPDDVEARVESSKVSSWWGI